jgi:hypothetical protein
MIALVAAGAIWLIYAVVRSPHRNELESFGQYAAAVLAIAAGIAGKIWGARTADDKAPGAGSPGPDRLADMLAGAVKDQWARAAAERGLAEPEPIPVRYARPAVPLAGPPSAAVASRRFSPLPGLAAVSAQRLRGGRLSDLHAVYGGLGSGRLVIAGLPARVRAPLP